MGTIVGPGGCAACRARDRRCRGSLGVARRAWLHALCEPARSRCLFRLSRTTLKVRSRSADFPKGTARTEGSCCAESGTIKELTQCQGSERSARQKILKAAPACVGSRSSSRRASAHPNSPRYGRPPVPRGRSPSGSIALQKCPRMITGVLGSCLRPLPALPVDRHQMDLAVVLGAPPYRSSSPQSSPVAGRTLSAQPTSPLVTSTISTTRSPAGARTLSMPWRGSSLKVDRAT
jgi:hypothetical protein